MKNLSIKILTSLMVITLIPYSFASSNITMNARSIMEKVDQIQRDSNHSTFSKSRLSSCKFGKKDKRIVCTEKPRVKLLETVQKQYGENYKDSKSVSIVLESASEKGIGMLTYSYDDPSKDTQSWLYLSALGKVKRMVSGGEKEKEPVSFFGSEFTTEDMESGKTDEFDYKILKEGPYAGTEVWVIESIPKEKRLKKTRYSKSITWIDKKKMVMLKVQSYDKRGKLWKKVYAKRFELMNGIWIARETTVTNLKSQRLSTIYTDEIIMDVDISEEFLTQRTLTDFAFREKNLKRLRASAK